MMRDAIFVEAARLDLSQLVTHQYHLNDIAAAYELFANKRDGVLKVAIKPN
jgi:threonine dehydrogenase-like Zn-dependent dehydrogenase